MHMGGKKMGLFAPFGLKNGFRWEKNCHQIRQKWFLRAQIRSYESPWSLFVDAQKVNTRRPLWLADFQNLKFPKKKMQKSQHFFGTHFNIFSSGALRILYIDPNTIIDLRYDVGEGSPLPTSRRDRFFNLSNPIHQKNPYFDQKVLTKSISHINHHNAGINSQC